jgi:acetyl esterase/lipase
LVDAYFGIPAINYRLSPEVRFPCALHDVIRGYMRLTDSLKISPDNIIVMGDSAGGSLAIALSMYLRDNGYGLPRALVVMSPWVDMTMSCGSWDENSKYDVIPMPDSDGESCSRSLESHYSFSKAECPFRTLADHLNPIQCYMGPEGMKVRAPGVDPFPS